MMEWMSAYAGEFAGLGGKFHGAGARVGRVRPVYRVRRMVSKLIILDVGFVVVLLTVPSKKEMPLVGFGEKSSDKPPSDWKTIPGKSSVLVVVKMRTDIFIAVGKAEIDLGKRATPWGRTIQEPTIVAGKLVLVAFHATTAIERYL